MISDWPLRAGDNSFVLNEAADLSDFRRSSSVDLPFDKKRAIQRIFPTS